MAVRPSVAGLVTLVHPEPDRGEALARILRSAGHRVVNVADVGRRLGQAVLESAPDLLVASGSLREPTFLGLVRSLRQALGNELDVLAVLDGASPLEALSEADEMIREPVSPDEFAMRVGHLLRSRAERRVLQRKAQELLGLYKLSWAFSLAGGGEALFGHLAKQSAELLKAERGLVLLFDAERRQMVGRNLGFGLTREQVARLRYPVDGDARSRWNFRKNGPLVSNKAQADTRLLTDIVVELNIQNILAAPITRGPQIQGLLIVMDRAGRAPFGDEDLNLLLALAGQASVAVENLKLHDEIKRTNALLQEYDRLKSEFVAIVAHDFRKPLMAIRGFAELVLEEPDIPVESRQDFMRTVVKETDQLALLANDTLLITQIETGQFEYRWTEVDLGPFVLDTVPLGLSDHSVLMDIPPGFPKIWADPDRLRQLLTNLTTNAVKYSPNGGSITVRCRERGPQHIVVEVIDHGLGIPQDQIGKLFQKFQRVRTDDHLAISGTGLGLYICRLIVEGHGGQIWVESELGKGSTFGLVLPVDARTARRPTKESPEGASARGPGEPVVAPRPASPGGG